MSPQPPGSEPSWLKSQERGLEFKGYIFFWAVNSQSLTCGLFLRVRLPNARSTLSAHNGKAPCPPLEFENLMHIRARRASQANATSMELARNGSTVAAKTSYWCRAIRNHIEKMSLLPRSSSGFAMHIAKVTTHSRSVPAT